MLPNWRSSGPSKILITSASYQTKDAPCLSHRISTSTVLTDTRKVLAKNPSQTRIKEGHR